MSYKLYNIASHRPFRNSKHKNLFLRSISHSAIFYFYVTFKLFHIQEGSPSTTANLFEKSLIKDLQNKKLLKHQVHGTQFYEFLNPKVDLTELNMKREDDFLKKVRENLRLQGKKNILGKKLICSYTFEEMLVLKNSQQKYLKKAEKSNIGFTFLNSNVHSRSVFYKYNSITCVYLYL
jgi:hypothetical protein